MKYPSSAWLGEPVQQLLIRDLLSRVRSWAPDQTISYRELREITYSEFLKRVNQLAIVLTRLGVQAGDRVGVMDWDSHRYLELFFAIPMLGAVIHTVNVRLSSEQILYTVDHAADSLMLVHPDFFEVAEAIAPRLPKVRHWITLSDDALPPATSLASVGDYESLLAGAELEFDFPDLNENTVATLFYTTGTTGDPKGVYFTHRQIVLHTLAEGLAFAAHNNPFSLSDEDIYLPLTPMFHVHAWGFPYLATMLGLKQVYPGRFEPQRLLRLLAQHRVTISHCVPTVLLMLLNHPESKQVDWSRLKIVIGGAPLPIGLAQAATNRGIRILGAYGMSETCPIIAASHIKPTGSGPTEATSDPLGIVTRTGFPIPLVDVAIMDSAGVCLPAGRANTGELVLRAPWLTRGYLDDPLRSEDLWKGGWLHTGDIAYRDNEGYIRITDRLKDVIKLGGEWISTLELENAFSQHPAVKEVAVVGVPDPKWDERPHAEVVLREGTGVEVTPRALLKFLHSFIDNGTLHQRVILTQIRFAATLPRTSVGKVDKKALRLRLQNPPAENR